MTTPPAIAHSSHILPAVPARAAMASGSNTIQQAAAVPLKNGLICLVKSSSGRRWVIPKGCMEPRKSAGEIALQEAWEEAGLVGVLQREPLGSYIYEKLGSVHHVIVFHMRVTETSDTYPEVASRERIWLKPAQALARIEDEGLCEIIRGTLLKNRIEVG